MHVMTNKKLTKAKLPPSTNSDVLEIKKKLRRLKLEMTRNHALNYNPYLQNNFKVLSDYLMHVRQLESDFTKSFDPEASKSRKEYQLRRFKDKQNKDFEFTHWVFSRKFFRQFGIDKGLTVYIGDLYKKIDDDGMTYQIVTVAEEPETTGLVVVMRSYKANDVSGKNKSVFVELGDFVNNFILFAVSTPDFEDYIECRSCGEHMDV